MLTAYLLPRTPAGDIERLSARQVYGVRASEVVIVDNVARIGTCQCGFIALLTAAGVPGTARNVRPDDVNAVRAYLRGQLLPVPA